MKLSPGPVARTCARRPWLTIAIWIVVAISLIAGTSSLSQKPLDSDFTSAVDSKTANELREQHGLADKNAHESIVIRSDADTVDSPAFKTHVQTVLTDLQATFPNDVAQIINHYDAPTNPQLQGLVSADKHMLLIPVTFAKDGHSYNDQYGPYKDFLNRNSSGGFVVQSAGDITAAEINDIIAEDMSKDVSIGMPIAAVILIVVFGALLAAGVPLVLGAVTIMLALALTRMLGTQVSVSEDANTVVSMIGMAIGIDYSLFILERFREERRAGANTLDAIERSASTAGKAVIFSGGSVLLALTGLVLMPLTVFRGMGLGTVMAVLVAVAASMTLVPALLRLSGDWINFPRFGTIRKLRRQDATGEHQFNDASEKRGLWGRIAEAVMGRPVVSTVATVLFLIGLTIPATRLELGPPSVSALPQSGFRASAELIAEHWGAGVDTPLHIVIPANGDVTRAQGQGATLIESLKNDSRFDATKAQVITSPDQQIVMVDIPLTLDPAAPEAEKAVRDLRTNFIPTAIPGVTVHVAGDPAMMTDVNTTLSDNLPAVFAFVLGMSFLLLMVSFRSLLLPLVSIILNLLSVGAAYGAVTVVFQTQWISELFGFSHSPNVISWLPLMLFCILFGLSMDYHVFILSRIREAYDLTGDANGAIRTGVQKTGRIITGAALIMVAVFSTFALGRFSAMQQMGFGLAFAVLLDATLIRMILVPAVLKLLGTRVWWFPSWLRWMPQLHIEGSLKPIRLKQASA